MVDVGGSNRSNTPLVAIAVGQVAQSVEQGTENPRVGSSILSLATIFIYLNQQVIKELSLLNFS